MSRGREVVQRYNLLTSEASYASQTSQYPGTSRRVLSWLPEADGQLHREAAQPKYIDQALSGPVVSLFNFNQSQTDGTVTRFYFAAARTSFFVDAGDFLGPCYLYMQSAGVWSQVSVVGTLATAPMFRTIGNLLFMSDGVTEWCFDGVNWFNAGIGIPYQGGFTRTNQFAGPPFWQCAIDNTTAGTFTCAVGRYYWFTNADQTATRPVHEGSSSAIGLSTGAVTNKKIKVYQTPGLWSVTSGSRAITISASADAPGPTLPLGAVSPSGGSGPATLAGAFMGLTLYINGTLIGVIKGVEDLGGSNFSLMLVANSPSTIANGRPVLCDARCTHWNIYASESDGSKVGQFLNQSIPVTQNLATTPATDQSTFLDDAFNTFASQFRPVRNDKPVPSKILEVHKTRLWRTRATKPNLFNYTANEEVQAGVNGNPVECVPGIEQAYTATGTAQQFNTQQLAGLGTSSGGGSTPWTNPNNVTSAVNFADFVASHVVDVSQFLTASTFGFAIPATATIVGVTVTLDLKATAPAGGATINCQAYMQVGGSFYFLDNIPDASFGTSSSSVTLGSATSLPGGGFTPTTVNASSFGVLLQAAAGFRTVSFRNVTIRVFYSLPIDTTVQDVENTISDLVSENSFPDQSNKIRAMISHADALYIGSERQVFPLYGESYDDFAISQVTAFSVGMAGRFCGESTMHGLPFISYDKKALLYPSATPPVGANATAALIEIGLPIRNRLAQISTSGPQLDEVVTKHYFYGKRDWWLVGFRNTGTGVYETWVFDFNLRGWFQLQRGFASFAIFELNEGQLILVGGADDGKVYVIDDQTNTFTSTDDLPAATWRPALIDFGDPDSMHIAQFLELEFTNSLMPDDITVTFWLDPPDADNPGTGTQIDMQRIKGANRYRGWFNKGGSLCHRLLIEVAATASQNAGAIRGAKLVAQKVKGLIGNPEGLTSGN